MGNQFRHLPVFQVISLQTQLKEQTDRSDSLSEQLQHLQNQSEETTKTIDSLKQELKVFAFFLL